MAERPITIHSICETSPDQHVHVKAGDSVRWRAHNTALYFLHIRGGFFQNEPDDFVVPVLPKLWTKDYIVDGRAGSLISSYIYDLLGNNCALHKVDGPPEIIIDGTVEGPKKVVAKKTAAAKRKK